MIPAIVCMTFALEFGGNQYPWDSVPIVARFIAAGLLFTAFVLAEIKASEPIVSFDMFRNRAFADGILVSLRIFVQVNLN
ncbi:MAG: hypothetical protein ACYCVB_10960 [Bacilli bacterium]